MSAVVAPPAELPATPAAAAPAASRAAPAVAPAGVAKKPDSGDGVPSAIERLALSRERLRDAMLPAPRRRTSGNSAIGDGLGSFASGLVDRVRAIPGVTILLEAIEDWWARHPLHSAGLVAAEASRRVAAPIAERRPLTLLLGAVLVGALLALLKPWRWVLRPALFAGLIPALLARSVRELPIEHWLQVAAGLAAPRPPSTPARAESAAAAARAFAETATPATTSPPHTAGAPAAVVREEPSAVYP